MPTLVVLTQTKVHSNEKGKVLATYSFDDPTQAQNVRDQFGYIYVNDGQEVVEASILFARDGSAVESLHMAYTVKWNGSEYEQTHWLVTDKEVESSKVLNAALHDQTTSFAPDPHTGEPIEWKPVDREEIVRGMDTFFTFNPYFIREMNMFSAVNS
jgi:hypothetical protein